MATWNSLSERQRDAVLWEKAFNGFVKWEEDRPYCVDEKGEAIQYQWAPGHYSSVCPVPHFTADLTAAMGLAEEMATKEYSYTLNCYPWFEPKYVASFWLPGEHGQHVSKADTLPEAAAHAAWLALGGE